MTVETGRQETIVKLTEENFDRIGSSSKLMLVDFWASWCGPCTSMEPVMERLASKYSDRVVFGKVNVDEEINISSRYQVFSIPTFMLFKGGQPLEATIGAVPEASLERMIRNAVDNASAVL